jgi:polyisoprenoid-binding protein YceI
MRARKFAILLAGCLLLSSAAFAAEEYKIDPVHTTVGFAVKHMVVNTVHGGFADCSGQIIYDERDPSNSSVNVRIRSASITTENEQRDAHLKSADFLDVQKFPEITFESKSVEKTADGFMAHGVLTIHGVSKNVDLPFKINGPISVGKGKLMGVEAGLTINRQDYGVAWSKSLAPGELVVANDVKIDINVEAGQVQPSASGAGAAK